MLELLQGRSEGRSWDSRERTACYRGYQYGGQGTRGNGTALIFVIILMIADFCDDNW